MPFVVNDDVDLALACDADGVHVGQSDIQGRDIRALIGPEKILGITANTVELALAAQRAGADYIGVGAVFGTTTKKDAKPLSVAAAAGDLRCGGHPRGGHRRHQQGQSAPAWQAAAWTAWPWCPPSLPSRTPRPRPEQLRALAEEMVRSHG